MQLRPRSGDRSGGGRGASRRRAPSTDATAVEILEARALLSAQSLENAAPTIGELGPAVNYGPGAPPIPISLTAVVADADSANFNGGQLRIQIAQGANSFDRLGIANQGTGQGQISVAEGVVRFGGVPIGTFGGGSGGGALEIGFNSEAATPAAVQALTRAITFRSATGEPPPGPRNVTFRVSDGDGGTSAVVAKNVNVVVANQPPVITELGPNINYAPGAPPLIVSLSAVVNDPDSANFNGGQLRVQITQGANSFDRLGIANQGTGAGQIAASEGTVFFGGVAIGTFGGGSGGGALEIGFNSNAATRAAVQALTRAITYRSATGEPPPGPRLITFRVSDGDGGTSAPVSKTVTVGALNQPPAITELGPAINYGPGAPPIILSTTARVTDGDSANFNGGQLRIQIAQGANSFDRLGIANQGTGAGQIAANEGTVFFGGVAIGTFGGGSGGGALEIAFNSNAATPAAVQALTRAITFRSATGTPAPGPRSVTFRVTDGDGGASAVVSKTVNVGAAQQAPTITELGPGVNYAPGSAPVVVSTTAVVADADSANFNGGQLRVQIAQGASPFDRLGIANQGTGQGQIAVSEGRVLFGGVPIATFAGGSGGGALEIAFNSNAATPAAVQALVRAITFRSATGEPPLGARTITFRVTDGDGGASAVVSKNVTVGQGITSATASAFSAYSDWTDRA